MKTKTKFEKNGSYISPPYPAGRRLHCVNQPNEYQIPGNPGCVFLVWSAPAGCLGLLLFSNENRGFSDYVCPPEYAPFPFRSFFSRLLFFSKEIKKLQGK